MDVREADVSRDALDVASPRWTLKPRRMGTVHIVRYWTTCRDGVEVDDYEDRSIAEAYVRFQNRRQGSDA